MSELMDVQNNRRDIRWRLLATVSVAALITAVNAGSQVQAAGDVAENPPVWIELGGQLAQHQGEQEAFLPPFVLATPRPSFITGSPADVEKMSPSSWDGTAKLAFEPAGSGWTFSAAVYYGKSHRDELKSQLTQYADMSRYGAYHAYQIVNAKNDESHAIVDFQASKDVGLGLFGTGGHSNIGVGVRFAQFASKSNASIVSQPTNFGTIHPYHRFAGDFSAARKFNGVGPSLSFDSDSRVIGDLSSGELAFDWGANAAILFGRQTAHAHHQTTDVYWHAAFTNLVYQHSANPGRRHNISVPNVGGFAGISWQYPGAKLSVGYRADFFFGAMDGGIDTAKKENVGFYGPFASVSVGLGG